MFTARYRQEKDRRKERQPEKERRKQRGKNGSCSFIKRKKRRKAQRQEAKAGKKEDLPKLARGGEAEAVKIFYFTDAVKGKGLTCPRSSKKP